MVTAAHAMLPSGDDVGEPMRLIAQRFSMVRGFLLAGMGRSRTAQCRGTKRAIVRRESPKRALRCGRMRPGFRIRGATTTSERMSAQRDYHPWISMQYRRLGSSGLKVSELSFGSWVTYGNQLQDQA